MRRWIDGLARISVLHLAAFAAASVGGAFGGGRRPAPGAWSAPGSYWDDVVGIGTHNARAFVLLVFAGIVFAGVAGLLLFAVNGFAFGQLLVGSQAPLTWIWLYAPLELVSFSTCAAASMLVGVEGVGWLFADRPVSRGVVVRSAVAVVLAAVGLGLAALLEGFAIGQAWRAR